MLEIIGIIVCLITFCMCWLFWIILLFGGENYTALMPSQVIDLLNELSNKMTNRKKGIGGENMSYTVETTENGFVETLELDGVRYYKEWKFTDHGAKSDSKDFCEQLKENGETDNALLDKIYDALDSSDLAYDFAYIKKVYM